MARVETTIGKPDIVQKPKLPASVTLYPRSYLGEPREWGRRDFPPATTVSPRSRIGSLPHGKESVK